LEAGRPGSWRRKDGDGNRERIEAGKLKRGEDVKKIEVGML